MGLSLSCGYGLRTYNPSSTQKLKIVARDPDHFCLRIVMDEERMKDYQTDKDGKVVFEFPTLPRFCDVYLLDLVKIKDADPYKRKVIQIIKQGSVVKVLSFSQLTSLDKDGDGYFILKIRD